MQNRGRYLERERDDPQFRPLWSWMLARESALANALWPNLILFGEWCYAVHSVAYDQLPDWFLGFDVYDRNAGAFWDTPRRDALLAELHLQSVPCLARGVHSRDDLVRLLSLPSRVGAGPIEGIVIRSEAGGFTAARAKLVRAEFTQAIEEHWSRGPLRRNELAEGATPWL